MHVRFWGVRGSIPTPATGEDVAARLVAALSHLGQTQRDNPLDLSDSKAIERWVQALPPTVAGLAGGNTPCLEMRTDAGELFIIDFGSGLRALGDSLSNGPFGRGEGHAHLFLSHLHWDHIQGWPFFRPVYIGGNEFDLYARHENVETLLKQQQDAPFFPPAAWDEMNATVRVHTLSEDSLTLCNGAVRVSSLELEHPSRAFAYRFEADHRVFVYASDGAFPPADSDAAKAVIEFFRDADLLVFDAQFSRGESVEKHAWGHSSGVSGVELGCRAKVKRLALFHHAPGATEAHLQDLLRAGQEYALHPALPCSPAQVEVFLAREGLQVEL